MNQSFDLECLLGAKPKKKPNGQFYKGQTPHNKGKKWTEWMNPAKMPKVLACSEIRRKTGNPDLPGWNKKPIIGIKEGKEYWFKSAQAAADATGLIRTNISKCCRGERKHCGGFIWKFA